MITGNHILKRIYYQASLFESRKFFLYFLFLICSISCHIQSDNKPEEKLLTFKTEKPGMVIKLKNSGNKVSCFTIKLNENNFNNEDEIVEKIRKMPDEFLKEPVERKAWRFVQNNLDRSSPITPERWQHSPLLMINSIGFGQCDDFAAVLNFIWKKQGFQSRVWGLEGHVVPEVYINNKWQMYDPIHAVYYLNSKNEIAGVDELSAHPEFITHPIIDENIKLNDSINFFSAIRFSGRNAKKYESSYDNKVNNWYDISAEIMSPEICLPPGATMEFPVDYSSKIYTKTFLGSQKELHSFMKITLNEKWSGKISFPFVIATIKGKGEVEINGRTYNMEADSLNQYLTSFSTFNSSLNFINTSEEVEIYCLLNPLIFKMKGIDTLKLEGTNIRNISATIMQGALSGSSSVINSEEQKIGFLINFYCNFYKKNQLVYDSIIFNPENKLSNKNDLVRTIKLFFKSMDVLDINERKARTDLLLEKTEKVYPMLSGNKAEDQFLKTIGDPVTFIMFVSILEVSDEKSLAKLLNGK